MIEFKNVSKWYKESVTKKKVQALDNLSLKIPEGQVFGFLGPNGAGKSTAIKTLINLIRPTSGQAMIMGRDVGDATIRHNIGYLPENPYFYDHLTATEILLFGGRSCGLGKKALGGRIDAILEKVDLVDARNRRIRTYSKGMVQRVGLALALIHDPKIAILDEPMSGLDPIGRKLVIDLILELKQMGKTVFFSSHILADVERICDQVGVIAKGVLQTTISMDELKQSGESLEALFLRKAAGRSEETL